MHIQKFDDMVTAAKLLLVSGHLEMARDVLIALSKDLTTIEANTKTGMQSSYMVASAFSGNMDVTHIVQKYWGQRAKKIDFIKDIRSATGLGLKEAKDYVETIPGF